MKDDYGYTKGYLAENYVATELLSKGETCLLSWVKNEAEIEFILKNDQGDIIPLEVKSGLRLKAKSLTSYIRQHRPKFALKASANALSLRDDTVIRNIPLYLIGDYWKSIK